MEINATEKKEISRAGTANSDTVPNTGSSPATSSGFGSKLRGGVQVLGGAGQYIRGRAMSMTQSGAEISQMGKAKMQSGMAKLQGPVETNTGDEIDDSSTTQSASPRDSNPLGIASGKGIKPGAKANPADAVESDSTSSSPSTQRPAFRFKSDLKPKLRTTTSEREFESRLPVK